MSFADLARTKLKSSGLDHHSFRDLGVEVYVPEQTKAAGGADAPSLMIKYFDPRQPRADRKRLSNHPMWAPFERGRYLVDVYAGKDNKLQRYFQVAKSGVGAYYPLTLPSHLEWCEILKDPSIPIYITEGEFKAAKGCDMGFPTIGLGGVWNFYSRGTGDDFLASLEWVDWVQRKVTIVFDNDGTVNPNVVAAVNELSAELHARGAMPYFLRLPNDSGVKVGLDDYFLTHSAADFIDLLKGSEAMRMAEVLWRMNEKYTYIRGEIGGVFRKGADMPMRVDRFLLDEGNKTVREQILTPAGEMSYKQVSAAAKWLKWQNRCEVEGITYLPGGADVVDGRLNMWKPLPVTARKGDVTPWKELLGYIFGREPEGKASMKWFTQWLAYPLQRPGLKMYSCVLMWSPLQGVGKSLIGYVMEKIYGENFKEVDENDLRKRFNGWACNRQFIMGDEITGSDAHSHVDLMKRLISGHTITIEEKNIPEFTIPNYASFYLTSNRPTAIHVEDGDRRYFIWEVKEKAPDEFFKSFDRWYKNALNMDYLYHYLMNVDLTGFEPLQAPPMTDAKEEMLENGRSTLGSWIKALRESPDDVLVFNGVPIEGDLFTSEDLLAHFRRADPATAVKPNGFGNAMSAAGFTRSKGQYRWTDSMGRDHRGRVWFIRNVSKWSRASSDTILRYLKNSFKTAKPVAVK
jgi:hypothetical protein